MTHVETAKALFDAFTAADEAAVRQLCAPDLVAIQNYGDPMPLDGLIQFLMSVAAIVPDFHYEDAIRTATADGFVEEHRVCGTLPNGKRLNLAACVVGTVEGGRITRLRETADGAAALPLIRALAGA